MIRPTHWIAVLDHESRACIDAELSGSLAECLVWMNDHNNPITRAIIPILDNDAIMAVAYDEQALQHEAETNHIVHVHEESQYPEDQGYNEFYDIVEFNEAWAEAEHQANVYYHDTGD